MRKLRSSIEAERKTTTFPTLLELGSSPKPMTTEMITLKSSQNKDREENSEKRRQRRTNPISSNDILEPLSLPSASRNVGPYFESNKTSISVSARAGTTVMFDCPVALLQGRTVRAMARNWEGMKRRWEKVTRSYLPSSLFSEQFYWPHLDSQYKLNEEAIWFRSVIGTNAPHPPFPW